MNESSNPIDEMVDVVRTTRIGELDFEYVKNLNLQTAYDRISNDPGYAKLIDSITKIYDESARRNLSKERAAALVIGTIEDMVKYFVSKAVRERMLQKNSFYMESYQSLQVLEDLKKKVKKAQSDVEALERVYKERAKSQGVDQFKAYLLYAADTWGSDEEKNAVRSLVGKVSAKVKRAAKK